MIFKNLLRETRRRTLPRGFVAPYKPSELTPDRSLVMLAGRARDPRQAQRLIDRYGLAGACARKPRRRLTFREKLMRIIRYYEGSLTNDPMGAQNKYAHMVHTGNMKRYIKR